MSTQPQVSIYVFCEGCGVEVDSSSYPEKASICDDCCAEREDFDDESFVGRDVKTLTSKQLSKAMQEVDEDRKDLYRSNRRRIWSQEDKELLERMDEWAALVWGEILSRSDVKLNTATAGSEAHSPSTLQPKMSSPINITTEQIRAHRASRKASGLAGCITGRPLPEISFYGYSDVQSWRPSDPMQPHCFCFDCRDLWDSDAAIDLELIQKGHEMARWTYAELLPKDAVPPKKEAAPAPSLAKPIGNSVPLLPRTNGGGLSALGLGIPPLRIDTSAPHHESFEEVPTSLPAPRHRDMMNETKEERFKNDLAELRARIQDDLVLTMDKKRHAFDDDAERTDFIRKLAAEEAKLWAKLDAVNLLLKD